MSIHAFTLRLLVWTAQPAAAGEEGLLSLSDGKPQKIKEKLSVVSCGLSVVGGQLWDGCPGCDN